MVCSSVDGLLQWRVRIVCYNGDYGWSAPVERVDGLLQWRVVIVVESLDGLLLLESMMVQWRV
jgi:hypothetical protein